MRKFSMFRSTFWDSPIWLSLKKLPVDHLRVFLHLVHGPNCDITGIYRLSVGAIVDDTDVEPDMVRSIIETLANIGWCEFEPPVLWIFGHGNVVDQLGKEDWTANAKWKTAALRQLDALPTLPIVDRFRRRWALPTALPDGGGIQIRMQGIEGVSIGYRSEGVSVGYRPMKPARNRSG